MIQIDSGDGNAALEMSRRIARTTMKILRRRFLRKLEAIDDACPGERKRGWRGRVDGGWGGRGREGGEKAVLRKVRNIHPDCSCVFELGCRGAAPTAPKVHDTPVALEIRRRGPGEVWLVPP